MLHPSYSMFEQKTSAQLGISKAFPLQYINKAQSCYNEELHFALCSLREKKIVIFKFTQNFSSWKIRQKCCISLYGCTSTNTSTSTSTSNIY